MLRILFSIVVLSGSINNSFALNSEKLDQLTELMILGCSLGKDVGLKVSAEGNLMLLKKGVKGSFESKRSEMPNIIKFLTSDKAKTKQAGEIRKCTMHYMDKIFDELIGDSNKINTEFTKDANGVVIKLLSCNKKNRNNIICNFNLVSTFRDRAITIRGDNRSNSSQLFDNAANRYFPNKINIANHNSRINADLYNIPIIADVKTNFNLTFKNISSQAKSISLLKVSTRISVDDKNFDENFDFRDIKIK